MRIKRLYFHSTDAMVERRFSFKNSSRLDSSHFQPSSFSYLLTLPLSLLLHLSQLLDLLKAPPRKTWANLFPLNNCHF